MNKQLFRSASIEKNLDQFEGSIAYKTMSHEIIHCNRNFFQSAGYRNVKKIVGKTDYDLAWQEHADIYHQQEKDILKGNSYSAFYPCKASDGRFFLAHSQKYLWTNEEGKTLGIISYGVEIQSVSLTELGFFLQKMAGQDKNVGYYLGKQSLEYPLSQREQECLFYIIRGKTAKEIANILGISYYTVETYTDRLKIKFNAQTKAELIDTAIKAGLSNLLVNRVPIR